MLKLLTRRVVALIPILFLVTVMAQLLIELTPGDPAERVAGDLATPEQVEAVRERLELDGTMVERYVSFVGDALSGDLGESIYTDRPVFEMITDALPVTLSLAAFAMSVAVLTGIPAGVLSSLRPDSILDRAVTALCSVALAVPPFVLAIILVIPLAIERQLLPATGYVPFTESAVDWLRSLVLPGLALAIAPAAELTRQTRGAYVDVMEADYVRTARANGFGLRRVITKYAARNAAIPVVTVLGLQFGRVVGGTVVIEALFGLPGMGTLAVSAVRQTDFPLIQGLVLVSGVIFVFVNLLVDLSYGVLNPKVRAA